jgi:Zn-dependent protease with chaperone function
MRGVYYDSKSSYRRECALHLNDNRQLELDGVDVNAVPLDSVSISPRIGDSTRFITFPNDAVFETPDNDGVDALLAETETDVRWLYIHYWERNKKLILLSVMSLVSFTYLLVIFGIPLMSRSLAHALPASVSVKLAGEVLQTLDDRVFSPTQLSEQRQQQLREQFNSLNGGLNEFQFKIHFRKGNAIGANAFALPDGAVVMTDELVALADNDLELESVMLHEIGHVVHRHALRLLIENSSAALVLIWLTGDIEASSSWFAALPTILLQSGYSRDVEREADSYALERMLASGISPQYFADMMKKLNPDATSDNVAQEKAAQEKDNQEPSTAEVENDSDQSQGDSHHWLDYISSHPATASRIRRFEEAAASQQPGLSR